MIFDYTAREYNGKYALGKVRDETVELAKITLKRLGFRTIILREPGKYCPSFDKEKIRTISVSQLTVTIAEAI